MTTPTPTQCHLWQKDQLTQSDMNLNSAFAVRKTYVDESHFIRRLLQCKDCGQLYFYQFSEEIDWETGSDPQHRMWVPVTDEEEADRISQFGQHDLSLFSPRIESNWPKAEQAPVTRWIGK